MIELQLLLAQYLNMLAMAPALPCFLCVFSVLICVVLLQVLGYSWFSMSTYAILLKGMTCSDTSTSSNYLTLLPFIPCDGGFFYRFGKIALLSILFIAVYGPSIVFSVLKKNMQRRPIGWYIPLTNGLVIFVKMFLCIVHQKPGRNPSQQATLTAAAGVFLLAQNLILQPCLGAGRAVNGVRSLCYCVSISWALAALFNLLLANYVSSESARNVAGFVAFSVVLVLHGVPAILFSDRRAQKWDFSSLVKRVSQENNLI